MTRMETSWSTFRCCLIHHGLSWDWCPGANGERSTRIDVIEPSDGPANACGGKSSSHPLPMRRPVSEQLLAFLSEKTAGDGDVVIALLEDEPAGDETSSPLVVFRAALAAKGGNVFLRDAVDDSANSRPHASTGAHGAGLVRRVENEVGQVAAIAA